MNVQNITLDLSKAIMAGQIVRMGQGDNEGTTIHATILDNSTVPSLTGMSARFYMRMPDGIHYVRDANCTISGNVITYVVDEEHCCAVAGYTDEAYFEVANGTTEYSTSRFRVKVERAANDGAVPVESWDTEIDAAIRRANEAAAEAEEAAHSVIEVPTMSTTEKGIAKLMDNGGLYIQNDALGVDQTKVVMQSEKGSNGGVAELDGSGKVPESQLPSYVDDVLEYASMSAFPATGESGKIYVDKSDNKTYRWTGTTYVGISSSLALGETSSTAYRGDRGKAAYDHAQAKGSQYASGFYKVATNSEGHVTGATSVQKSDITALGIASDDVATQSANGLMSSADKRKLDDMDGTTEPITNAQIDTIANDGTVTSTNVLQGTGLTYLWGKIKSKFAALSGGFVPVSQGGTGKGTHTSNAVLTGNGTNAVNNVSTASGAFYATSANGAAQFGTLPIAQGGTNATTAADAVENIVDGQDLKPTSVAATGEVSGKSGTGASAVTHKLTEKLDTDDYRKALKWSEVSDEWLWGETGQTPSTQGTTYTDNLNLIKPGLETTISIDDFNDNFDIIDEEMENRLSVADYRKAMTWGEVKDQYTWGILGTTSQQTGTTYTTNYNLTKAGNDSTVDVAVLNDNFDTIDDAIADNEDAIGDLSTVVGGHTTAIQTLQDSVGRGDCFVVGSGVSMRVSYAYRVGRLCMVRLIFDVATAKANNDVLFTITDSRFKPLMETVFNGNNSGTAYVVRISTEQTVLCGNVDMPAKTWYAAVMTYISAE